MPMDPRTMLATDFPELRLDAIEPIGEGWDHVAFLVNDAFVFRLPRHLIEPTERRPEAASALPEVALLRAVTGKLAVAVPEPAYVADHGHYFGYPFLPGTSLEALLEDGSPLPGGESGFASLVVDVVVGVERAVATDLAVAVGIRAAEVPSHPGPESAALRSGVLSAPMRAAFDSVAEALPKSWAQALTRPTVTLHADLGLDHWLVKEGEEAPHALIDWSDSCIGPPELQLSALMWHVPDCVAAVARRYAQEAHRMVDGDLIFCCGYENAVSDVGSLLDEGDADEDDIDWCLEFLQRWSDPDLASTLRGVQFGD